MRKAISNGVTTSYVNLLEVAHYVRNLPKNEFFQLMKSIQNLSTLTLTSLDNETATLAVEIMPEHAPRGLGGRDCIIIASMNLAGIRSIATHDGAFKRIKGISVIDEIPSSF